MRNFYFPPTVKSDWEGDVAIDDHAEYWEFWALSEHGFGPEAFKGAKVVDSIESMCHHFSDEKLLEYCWSVFLWLGESETNTYRDPHKIAIIVEQEVSHLSKDMGSRIAYLEHLMESDKELMSLILLTQ